MRYVTLVQVRGVWLHNSVKSAFMEESEFPQSSNVGYDGFEGLGGCDIDMKRKGFGECW